jgi:hypothetical protein
MDASSPYSSIRSRSGSASAGVRVISSISAARASPGLQEMAGSFRVATSAGWLGALARGRFARWLRSWWRRLGPLGLRRWRRPADGYGAAAGRGPAVRSLPPHPGRTNYRVVLAGPIACLPCTTKTGPAPDNGVAPPLAAGDPGARTPVSACSRADQPSGPDPERQARGDRAAAAAAHCRRAPGVSLAEAAV